MKLMLTRDDLSPEERLIDETFFPVATAEYARLFGNPWNRLVHYTSAEVAVSIIRNQSIWMRNAQTMNDFSEVQHGLECLHAAWHDDDVGGRFKSAIDAIHSGVAEELAEGFDPWQQDLLNNTYLTCLSEHPADEARFGRLSMWRSYGQNTGVALVLNTTPFRAVTDDLAAYSSPVFYSDSEGLRLQLKRITDRIRENRQALSALDRGTFLHVLTTVFRFAAMCTKHPAFKEEREWRVMYSPALRRSPAIEEAVEVVRGVPQIVQKIPLIDDPSRGLHGADLPSILDYILIVPTEDPLQVKRAMVSLLEREGVADATDKVVITGVPLRT